MTYKQRCEIMEKALNDIIYQNSCPPWANSLSPFVQHMDSTVKIAKKALEESK